MTEPSTAALPAGVTHVTITCDKVAQLIADRGDAGTQADGLPMTLDVEFVAPVGWERYPGAGLLFLDRPVLAAVRNGVLVDRTGAPGVGLIAPREGWTWRVRLLSRGRVRAEFPILVQQSPEIQRLDEIMVASAIPGKQIVQGPPGPSSYDLAVEHEGFEGTVEDYLASLHGEDGEDGAASMARSSTTDLDASRGPSNAGAWVYLNNAANRPEGGYGGTVTVSASKSSGVTGQIAHSASDAVFSRYWNGTVWSPWTRLDLPTTTANELRGTGSPLGVVAASPGTYYTDTAGTFGAWRWLKTSGTGTSGWTVVIGDTGWRDVTSMLHADWVLASAVPQCRMRLTQDGVQFHARLSPGPDLIGVVRNSSHRTVLAGLPGSIAAGLFEPLGDVYISVTPAGGLHSLASLSTLRFAPFATLSGSWAAGDIVAMRANWTITPPWITDWFGTLL